MCAHLKLEYSPVYCGGFLKSPWDENVLVNRHLLNITSLVFCKTILLC